MLLPQISTNSDHIISPEVPLSWWVTPPNPEMCLYNAGGARRAQCVLGIIRISWITQRLAGL